MPSPFPGMDPYLEEPSIWKTVHHWMISVLAETLGDALPERYWVAVEKRSYLVEPEDLVLIGRPDASVVELAPPKREDEGGVATLPSAVPVTLPLPDRIRESYLEIRDPRSGLVITVLEVLSPWNKRPGTGRREYLRKREAILSTETNLVEIDLLRAGPRMPMAGAPESYDHGVMISRGVDRPSAELFPWSVRDPLPRFLVPLRPGEIEPAVDLGAAHAAVYDRGRFSRMIDYGQPPNPPLRGEVAAWADALLRHAGLRE